MSVPHSVLFAIGDTVLRRRISAGTPQQEENLRVFQHTLEEMRLHWFQRQSPVIHLAMIDWKSLADEATNEAISPVVRPSIFALSRT